MCTFYTSYVFLITDTQKRGQGPSLGCSSSLGFLAQCFQQTPFFSFTTLCLHVLVLWVSATLLNTHGVTLSLALLCCCSRAGTGTRTKETVRMLWTGMCRDCLTEAMCQVMPPLLKHRCHPAGLQLSFPATWYRLRHRRPRREWPSRSFLWTR